MERESVLPLIKGTSPGMVKPRPPEPLVKENSALWSKKGSSTTAFSILRWVSKVYSCPFVVSLKETLDSGCRMRSHSFSKVNTFLSLSDAVNVCLTDWYAVPAASVG